MSMQSGATGPMIQGPECQAVERAYHALATINGVARLPPANEVAALASTILLTETLAQVGYAIAQALRGQT